MRRKNTILMLAALVLGIQGRGRAVAVPDTGFLQPVSLQYPLPAELEDAQLLKVLVDGDDVVHVLSSQGLYWLVDGRLARDLRYRPLAGRNPVDVAVQEKTGDLYYLYGDAWLSNSQAGTPFARLPEGHYRHIAVAADGGVLVAGAQDAALYRGGGVQKTTLPPGRRLKLTAHGNEFFALFADGVFRLEGGAWQRVHAGHDLRAMAFQGTRILLGTDAGYYGVDQTTGDTAVSLQARVPVQDTRDLLALEDVVWAATPQGAYCRNGEGACRYFASRRWLNDDEVLSLAANSQGDIFLLTPRGLSEIRFRKQTYLGKARTFEKNIRQRHIRYGLLAETRMKTPGDLATSEMIDTDNDGLWSAFYLGALAFRYQVTHDPVARTEAWETFTAYERLLSVNPLDGFPSRTFERKGFKVSDPKAWRPSQDSGWEWKGTTSSDEFVGYIFIAALMDEFVAQNAAEKKRVAAFIDTILTHIIRHGYTLQDSDGQPTLWGRWYPDYINWYPPTIGDRRLGSITIIAGLQLGYALTGKTLYRDEARRLMQRDGYLQNILIDPARLQATPGYIYKGHDMGNGHWNHSDDEMAFLSYWVLYRYAFDDTLKQQYATTIRKHWEIESPEKNPVWNLITLGTEGSFDQEGTLWYLREFPMDLVRWNVVNSHRKDLTFLPANFRQQYTRELLSPAERPTHRFNANEFNLDGGEGGKTELTGAEYLLAYWMARYLHVIDN